jgi:hypothetical protein
MNGRDNEDTQRRMQATCELEQQATRHQRVDESKAMNRICEQGNDEPDYAYDDTYHKPTHVAASKHVFNATCTRS